jgi:polyisoprenoid-binding protein YceI
VVATRTTALVQAGTWKIDPAHSSIEFSVKHMGITNVRGRFADFEGTVEVGEDAWSAQARGTVRVGSIDTGDDGRDAHLRSADFFDADAFPEMTFESTRVEPIDDDSSRVFGNLTMHGVTREIKLVLTLQGTDTDPWGNERAGAEAQGVLSRKDFDMHFNQALGSGNVLVGDQVRISLDLSAVLKK